MTSPTEAASPQPCQGRANVAALEGCYQLVLWLIPILDNLPRRQKFQLGDRIETAALDILQTLIEAAYTKERQALLHQPGAGAIAFVGFVWPKTCNCWTLNAMNMQPAWLMTWGDR